MLQNSRFQCNEDKLDSETYILRNWMENVFAWNRKIWARNLWFCFGFASQLLPGQKPLQVVQSIQKWVNQVSLHKNENILRRVQYLMASAPAWMNRIKHSKTVILSCNVSSFNLPKSLCSQHYYKHQNRFFVLTNYKLCSLHMIHITLNVLVVLSMHQCLKTYKIFCMCKQNADKQDIFSNALNDAMQWNTFPLFECT